MPESGRLAAQRRHTLYFLRWSRAVAPVFLDTEVDMTRVLAHREQAAARGRRISVLSYVVRSATEVLARHPACNAVVGGGLVPRIRHVDEVRPKIAMDRTVAGQRVVLSAVLPDQRGADLDEIQDALDRLRDTPAEELPELRGTLLLHRLPAALGWPAFRATVSRLSRRPGLLGTVAVSSLGHRAVDGFHAVGGTTCTLNLGRVRPTPVVRDGAVVVAPVLRLNLAFDHRVVDGAEAADVLTEITQSLEDGDVPSPLPVVASGAAASSPP
ncbi:2-oxo acid dehydrogenase subunit E2 [Micromonospora mangrovi]|uniref:2-oxo acid dehydrogenase subunit E2 n=2 Tax=Micromonospora TaxID=1873 RepID=A0AAU8HNC4_9ACTN